MRTGNVFTAEDVPGILTGYVWALGSVFSDCHGYMKRYWMRMGYVCVQ